MLRPLSLLVLPIAMLAWFSNTSWGVDKPKAQPVTGKIKWVFDYEEGKKVSAATNKPMFVVFRCER